MSLHEIETKLGIFERFVQPSFGPDFIQSQAFQTASHQGNSRRPPKVRQSLELPMILRNARTVIGITINSRPDSGSEENVMTADVAQYLLLDIDSAPLSRKKFRVANGKSIESIGRAKVNYSFAREATVESCCFFYIFPHLICPVIMGMAFLDKTETLVKYRHRLQPRSIPAALVSRPFQMCSLDYPRRQLYCLADSQPKFANADTGSEINVMSLKYVQKRCFVVAQIGLSRDTVQFADGSISRLLGIVNVDIQIGTKNSLCYPTDFYILEDLTCDILLGEDFLDDTAAFKDYARAFALDDEDDGICEVNTIVWFNMVESKVARMFTRSSTTMHSNQGKSSLLYNDLGLVLGRFSNQCADFVMLHFYRGGQYNGQGQTASRKSIQPEE